MTHKIILETDDIVLHYNEGNSDFLLITFMGAYEEHHALHSYFCQPICEESNITCIGVTTKQRNWYHGTNMKKALQIIRTYCKKFSKVISFGPSAGGYAAIKYSKILKTDVTIAFAPLIIPNSDEEMQAMAIAPSHLFGEIFIFYDPKESRDAATVTAIENAAKTKKAATTHKILTPHAGHILLNTLKGRKNLLSFILTAKSSKLSAREKQKEFQKNVRTFSRYTFEKLYNKIRAGHLRHPYLVYQMLRSQELKKVQNYKEIFHEPEIYYILVNRLQALGYTEEARAVFRTIMSYQLLGELDFFQENLEQKIPSHKVMIDHRGGAVSYFAQSQHFRSDNPIWQHQNANPVLIKKVGQKEYPFVSYLEMDFFFSKTETNITLSEKPGNLSIEYLNHQCCIKATDGTYLTISNGSEHYWSETPSEWERFSPITLFQQKNNLKRKTKI